MALETTSHHTISGERREIKNIIVNYNKSLHAIILYVDISSVVDSKQNKHIAERKEERKRASSTHSPHIKFNAYPKQTTDRPTDRSLCVRTRVRVLVNEVSSSACLKIYITHINRNVIAPCSRSKCVACVLYSMRA